MYESVLKRIQRRILQGDYVMTFHALEEMVEDGFDFLDVENGILTGDIVERQKEALTGDLKYVILGVALDEREIEIVAKFVHAGNVLVITVYEA